MNDVRVKICGLRDPRHAAATSRAGADYVGVVFAGRVRKLTGDEAAAVVAALEGETRAVGVFLDASPDEILRRRDLAGFGIAQLHGSEPPEICDALREAGLGIWKAIRPRSRGMLRRAWERYSETADAILVEGHSEAGPGGTGASFPHEWLVGLDRDRCALALAGGLHAGNVGSAIRGADPDIVDVSSGVERAPGEKSLERVLDFMAAVREARPAAPGRAGAAAVSSVSE